MKTMRKRLTALFLMLAVLLAVFPVTGAVQPEQSEVQAKLPTPHAYYSEGYLVNLVANEVYVANYLDTSCVMSADRFGRARFDIAEPCTVSLFRVGGIDTESSDEQVFEITKVSNLILEPYYYVLDVGETVKVGRATYSSLAHFESETAVQYPEYLSAVADSLLYTCEITALKPGYTSFTWTIGTDSATGYAYIREPMPQAVLYNYSTLTGLDNGSYWVKVGNTEKTVTVTDGTIDLYDEMENAIFPIDIQVQKLHAQELCCSEVQWISIDNEPEITLEPRTLQMQVGEQVQLSASMTNVSNYALAWRSWDTDILSVDNNGLVTALAIGMTEISASYGPWFNMCDVTVLESTPEAVLADGSLTGLVPNAVYDLTIEDETVRVTADAQGAIDVDAAFPNAVKPYTLSVVKVHTDNEACNSLPQVLQMYALIYDANGGEQAPAAVSFAAGESVTVTLEQPVRENYKFLGWSEDSDAAEAHYLGGETLTLEQTTTLYAVWQYDPQTAVQVGTVNAMSGDTIRIPVSITRNPGIALLDLTVTYDTDALTLTAIEQGTLLTGGSFSSNVSTGNFSWYDFAAVTGDGVLAYLTFRVKDDCAEGTYTVDVGLTNGAAANLSDGSFQPIEADFESGAVLVLYTVIGDLTGDKLVAADDAVLLTQAINHTVTLTDRQTVAADLNEDGSITILDAIQMAGLLTAAPESVASDRSTGDATISVDRINAVAGQTVTVPVRISGNPGLAGFALTVVYDNSAMTLTQITKGELLTAGTFLQNVETGCICFTNKADLSGDGVLLYLTFTVAEDAPVTTCDVSVFLREDLKNNLADEDLNAVDACFAGGAVQIGTAAIQNAVLANGVLRCDLVMEGTAGILAVALYENGQMVHVQLTPVTAGAKTVTVTYTGSFDCCKVFLLGSGTAPLSGCAVAEIQ